MATREELRALHIGSVRQLVGRLIGVTTGKMRKYLKANKINIITGKLQRSVNPLSRFETDKISISWSMPYYAKFVDNYKIFLGTGVSQKWTIADGSRLSKIPSNYLNPTRTLSEQLGKVMGKLTADQVEAIIQNLKTQYKRVE